MCSGVEPGQPLYGAGYKNGEGVCLADRELIGVGEESKEAAKNVGEIFKKLLTEL